MKPSLNAYLVSIKRLLRRLVFDTPIAIEGRLTASRNDDSVDRYWWCRLVVLLSPIKKPPLGGLLKRASSVEAGFLAFIFDRLLQQPNTVMALMY